MLRMLRARGNRATPERVHYGQRGYQVFRNVFDPAEVEALAGLVRSAADYEGKLLRKDGSVSTHDFFEGTRIVRNPLANYHLPLCNDVAALSASLRNLLTAPELADHLRRLDGAESYIIHQSLVFFAAQTTELHIDSWGVDTSPRGCAHTLWVPLQDMHYRAGVPAVVPWPLGEVVTEADLGLTADGTVAERYEHYHQAFARRILEGRPELVTAFLNRGDLVVWSSLTPHLTLPSMPFPIERLSLQVLLKPTALRRGTFLEQPEKWYPERAIRASEDIFLYVPENIHSLFGIDGDGTYAANPEDR